jgi:hypothetical protein
MKALARTTLFALASLLGTVARSAQAQEDDQVYHWETPEAGWFELQLLNAFVLASDAPYERFGGARTRAALEQHFAEVEYGLTDRWTAGVYADFERSPDGPFRYSGVRVESNYRFFERYQRVVELALHAEVLVPRPSSGAGQELETLLVLQRDVSDFRFVANPGFELPLSGSQRDEGVEFALGAGVYYRRFWRVQPALEYFATFGPVARPLAGGEQRHVLYPGARVYLAPGLSWLLSVGVGLNRTSDRWLARGLLNWEFESVRPAEQLR